MSTRTFSARLFFRSMYHLRGPVSKLPGRLVGMILKTEMVGKVKLEELARADTRSAQQYVEWGVEECRMAYRLKTKMFDSRANMPGKYKRDLECRACRPNTTIGQEIQEETQDHIEVCQGYRALWVGLGPLTPLSRVKYFIRVKNQKAKKQNISQ